MAERTPCAASIGDDQRDLPEPGRRRGDRFRRGLDTHRDIGDTSHVYLLVGNSFVLPHQGGIFLSWFATGYISLRNSWAGQHFRSLGSAPHAHLYTMTDE